MPSPMHELSPYASYHPYAKLSSNSYLQEGDAAKRLYDIMTSVELSPLVSEWWHFQTSSDCHDLISEEYYKNGSIDPDRVANFFASEYSNTEYVSKCKGKTYCNT